MSEKKVSDFISMRGSVEIALRNAFTDEVVAKREVENAVVRIGRRWVLAKIQSNSAPAEEINNMGVGTDTTTPATSDLALGNETDRNVIGTFARENESASPPSWQAQASWATDEANTTLAEVGLFQSSSGGTMLARATFTTLDKRTSNTLTISYTISN
jgi:hypothetical protein